jgi:predicted nucleic acid-binding Zn ribbon protein
MAPAFASLSDSLAPETLLADVQRAWTQAVGAVIAAEATPSAERAGSVTVSCSAAVWAQELDLMAPAILSKLNAALGGERVTRLRCMAVPRD